MDSETVLLLVKAGLGASGMPSGRVLGAQMVTSEELRRLSADLGLELDKAAFVWSSDGPSLGWFFQKHPWAPALGQNNVAIWANGSCCLRYSP